MATSQELVTDAQCYQACIPPGMVPYVQIAILQSIAGTDMTSQELMALGACYQACIPAGMAPFVAIGLLNEISIGGGGGGSSGVTCSPSSAPSGTPTGNCGLWIKLDSGNMWVYNSGSASWDQLF